MGKKVKVLTGAEAAMLIGDNKTVVSGGFVGSSCPETLTTAVENRFLETGSPKDLTLVYAAGQGNRNGTGADHFAHEGLVKRVVGGHWNMAPNLGNLVLEEKIEGYNLPQGVISHLFRDIAAGKIGTLTHVGLNTFVDPRLGGGKLNKKTTEDIVHVVNVIGKERLLYEAFPIDVALLRGTYADENGNITSEREVAPLDSTAVAQAAKNSGGIVIVQVEKIVKAGTLDPKLVTIPGIYVDAVVVAQPGEHKQTTACEFDPSFCGEIVVPVDSLTPPALSPKKVIAIRAALELTKDSAVNLGIGIPEFISAVANEEGVGDYFTLTVEAGPIGGVPQGGGNFGASVNSDAIIDQGHQFDFYDGGGLDVAFLGLAQADEKGNINVSKFGPRIAGCGGFINITQNAKKVVFCGTFTAGGLKCAIADGKLTIVQEGKEKKFLKEVEQITFSGEYAISTKQPVLYVTERAVFELREDGLYLTEVAPGIDVKTQILDLMDFVPKMDGEPKLMNEKFFKDELVGLKEMI